jgi:hypothetical protein
MNQLLRRRRGLDDGGGGLLRRRAACGCCIRRRRGGGCLSISISVAVTACAGSFQRVELVFPQEAPVRAALPPCRVLVARLVQVRLARLHHLVRRLRLRAARKDCASGAVHRRQLHRCAALPPARTPSRVRGGGARCTGTASRSRTPLAHPWTAAARRGSQCAPPVQLAAHADASDAFVHRRVGRSAVCVSTETPDKSCVTTHGAQKLLTMQTLCARAQGTHHLRVVLRHAPVLRIWVGGGPQHGRRHLQRGERGRGDVRADNQGLRA